MPLIQVPDIALKLFRRYRLSQQPDSVLGSEVSPVVIVDDLSDYLESGSAQRACLGGIAAGAVAAQTTMVALVNTLRERITITDIWFSSTTSQFIRILRPRASLAGFTTGGSSSFEDFRIPGEPQAVIQFLNGALPANSNMVLANAQASRLWHVSMNCVLFGAASGITQPDSLGSRAILVKADTVNTTLQVSFRWIEGAPEG